MARKFLTGIDLQSQRATNAADPSSATDLATKQYVDNSINGLAWKQPVRVATTTTGTLSTAYANGSTIDGVTLSTGMRILIKDQSTGTENGIYVVAASGAPTRATDADSTAELNNATVYVIAGTTNADKAFTQTANDVAIGTTALAFAQVGGGTTYSASNGVQLVSTTFQGQVVAGGGILVGGTGFSLDTTVAVRKYAVNVPAGSTSATITHGLGTLDVQVAVYVIGTGELVDVDVVLTSTTVVTLTFATAPTAGQYRAVVFA